MAKKYERFIVKEAGGTILKDSGVQMILVDRETGVNYLMVKSGYGAVQNNGTASYDAETVKAMLAKHGLKAR